MLVKMVTMMTGVFNVKNVVINAENVKDLLIIVLNVLILIEV